MAKIAACLICKNSVDTIERTLDSIRPFVDEINVYDTGSSDGTIALLESLNGKQAWVKPDGTLVTDLTEALDDWTEVPLAPIRVEKGEWRDDFSWAREQSFAMASDDVDWLFWLDDDDVIVGAQNLRPLAYTAHAAVDGFIVYYDYARDEAGHTLCQLWRERLLRRSTPAKWINPVHEVYNFTPENRLVNLVMVPRDQLAFVHDRPPDRYSPTRNLEILEAYAAEAEARGERADLRTRGYIGSELMSHQRFDEAIPHFEDFLRDPESRPGDERSQVYHKLATCLRLRGSVQAALEVEFQAIRERDDWSENAAGLAECFAALGDVKRTMTWAKRCLELGMPQSVLILNPLELAYLPLVRLSEAFAQVGDFEQARSWIMQALAMRPNDVEAQQLAMRVEREGNQAELVGAILLLRETLIRHDENWKAYELLQNVPYLVADHPQIVAARAMQTENVMHALKPDEYKRWYEDEPKESTVPDEMVPVLGEGIERAGFVLELAQRFEEEHGRKPRILDLGCNDAWMSCFLWTNGEFVCDGVELNKASYEKGLARCERFGTPARIVQGDLHFASELLSEPTGSTRKPKFEPYDIVTMFEVFEHVPDTAKTLRMISRLVNKGGLVCVTTPNGAFEQGQIDMWEQVERKGHLRALPASQFAAELLEHGTVEDFRVHHGGRLTFGAFRPAKHRGRVHLFAGGAWEPWSPASVRTGGLGGSETALTHLALGLRSDGFDVRVFTDAEPGIYGGTLWRPAAAFDPTEEADAIIVSRLPSSFDVELHAPVRALWCHDHSYPGVLTEQRAQRMTHVVTLSDWQRDRFARLYPFLEEKLVVRRNGILTVGFEGDERFVDGGRGFKERKPVCVYSSSADRGLDTLLELWPAIRSKVKKAELHVYYGWDVFDKVASLRPDLQAYKARVFELAEAAGGEKGGVVFKGRVGQPELYEAMAAARVWTYPTAFLETSCIGAMEARANGMALVTSDLGALHETVGLHGRLLPWSEEEDSAFNETDGYRKLFVDEVVLALTDETRWSVLNMQARLNFEQLDWRHRIKEWAQLIEQRAPKRALVAA